VFYILKFPLALLLRFCRFPEWNVALTRACTWKMSKLFNFLNTFMRISFDTHSVGRRCLSVFLLSSFCFFFSISARGIAAAPQQHRPAPNK